jgi:hypothetical protein
MEHSTFRAFVELQGQIKAARRKSDRFRGAQALSVRAGAVEGILPTTI